MTESEIQKICIEALKTYGEFNQKTKCIEECSELIQAISKSFVHTDLDLFDLQESILEEMADVHIYAHPNDSLHGRAPVSRSSRNQSKALRSIITEKTILQFRGI